MRVREIMSGNVVTAGTWETGYDAVTRMCRQRIRHLPVVGSDGRLAGIVTDRNLRHYLFVPDVLRTIGNVSVTEILRSVTVKEIMSAPVISVRPDDDLEEAARLMLEDKVGSLPVVEEGRVVGIVTETDLLRRIVDSDRWPAGVDCIVVSYP